MGDEQDDHTADPPLDPSGIAQFVEHDRCPRYLKQHVDPGDEATARKWREAYGLMNIALLGTGKEFEATQIEALAANATTVISPELGDRSQDAVPDITVDETWADSPRGRTAQLADAVEQAAALTPTGDEVPYILLYQVPLDGHLGNEAVYGDADCIALAPASALADTTHIDDATVVGRTIDCKSASEEQPAHRVQVAAYCALLEQTLAEGPCDINCHIEASVLTEADATTDTPQSPFDLPTFRRSEWELFVTQLLAEDGPVEEALADDLEDLPFALDQVCNNCAYREACATRAVENSRNTQSLALLGLNASTQRTLQDAGLTSLHDIATLAPPNRKTTPMDDPPQLDIDADLRRTLEESLPYPIHELVLRAQALYGEIEPDYPEYRFPPAIPGNDWVPLPDDRCAGWGNIDGADPGELIHVALFVRPDSAINRLGALGACITADDYKEYITIGEVIDAVPDDDSLATDVEADLFERFLTQLFNAIKEVATALGEPEQAVLHCYTYSEHELDVLTEALDRHSDSLTRARALRALCSLDEDGHTEIDQSMVTPVQPVINDHFALQSPSQGLLSVVDQFDASWTIDTFDPPDARPDDPPIRDIFSEQFLTDAAPYLRDDPGIRLHLGRGPLGEGPAADVVEADQPDPDGWYRIRKRSGGQFPLEYLWAAVPKRPDDDQPRLHPVVVEQWAVEDEHRDLYRQEINRFYGRTGEGNERLQRRDVTTLVERLSYSLQRLVEAIPYKNAYQPKEPLDVTELAAFEPPVSGLPAAARDYLRMEFGASRDATLAQYRSSLRERARSGRSMPVRCTDYTLADDGTLTITADLAYEDLFDDPATATQVAQQARLRSADGTSGGSWRVLTRLTQRTTDPDCERSPVQPDLEPTVDDPEDTKHSPPVFVDQLDVDAGEIVLTILPHRFRRHGSRFRVDHCGWQCPEGSNLTDPDQPPSERDGYVAERPPVWIDTDEVYMLDPMVDDFGAPKADRALRPETIQHNPLWQQLQVLQESGDQRQTTPVAAPAEIERFCRQMAASEACLTPNDAQQRFIEAVDRPLVPLQGPPGTGKTNGATAPALLARAYAHAQQDEPFTGIVIAPSHDAVDVVLSGVVDCLDNWRENASGLTDLSLVRVTPTPPPAETMRADADATQVAVTYAAYHSDGGAETLSDMARALTGEKADPTQRLLFATPATLYRVLGIVAETCSAIDGTSAPAAMRYAPGLADVVCIDEASMLDLPRLFLATSALTPAGQTLLVGDHRQLATVSEVDWTDTRRKPVTETGAYRSALEYVRDLATRLDNQSTPDDGSEQHRRSQFGDDAAGESR
ncbi:AAA family ATPase [Halovenus sp. WSH3]|uniref:AAA family ATPase n=1 Tax=Halovenus carboxidivorans TaxID=2692199 RepID=A0A6B0T6E1_9EURY|nr:AAA domain-containing protein [Halovenus carboxidivorans]MXR50440.1 AAA family ATPase [Halovenus carboxidivorans]